MRFLLLLLLSSPVMAGELSVEIGSDVVHAPGLRTWFISLENPNSRFRYGEAGQEGKELKLFSAEYVWRIGKWSPSLGIVHIDHLSPLNGTYHNFSLGLQYQATEKVFIGLIHFSHGSGSLLGIEKHRRNWGWNLITIGSRF